jgi:uncharacterized protein (TIGR03503 family)
VKVWIYCVIVLLGTWCTSASSQSLREQQDLALQTADGAVTPEESKKQSVDTSVISELGDDYTNSIELLKNRFRVDYNVDAITMVFFRKYGSAPVVLVRPDGSKLFQGRVDEEKVEWFDSDSFDMITIKNPVPGPWQAVGQVLPESRIMVVSDIELMADPLPNTLFSGEILKSTAYLTNGGKEITNNEFRNVVDVDIEFISTNNANYSNFGAVDELIATFKDNGLGMDERPADGIFTGQFNLKIAPGEWKPIFSVKTPMITREQEGSPIILHENPVDISVVMNENDSGYHNLIIDVDRELVQIESLLVDGKVRFPNGDTQNFSLTEGGPDAREYQIVAYEKGVFRVKLTAYGTTTDGRDFILDVPEYTFLGQGPAEPEVEDPLMYGEDPVVDGSAPLVSTKSEIPIETTQQSSDSDIDSATFTLLIIVINGSIIFIGLIVAVIIILKRKKSSEGKSKPLEQTSKQKAKDNAVDESNLTLDDRPKGINKLFAMFKKKKQDES